ncbi:MAG: hypothetical protein AB1489_42700 [Acidobacteriota bacterium]
MRAHLRLLGIIPLLLFFAHLLYHYYQGSPENMLWICHLANLLFGFGLLFNNATLVRTSTIWIIVGFPLWIMDMVVTGEFAVTSLLSHTGGLIIGLVALARIRTVRHSWVYAFIGGLIAQQLTRIITPRELNVNIAHKIYNGWEGIFVYYWQYWIFISIMAAFWLWLTGALLARLFPPEKALHKKEDYAKRDRTSPQTA